MPAGLGVACPSMVGGRKQRTRKIRWSSDGFGGSVPDKESNMRGEGPD